MYYIPNKNKFNQETIKYIHRYYDMIDSYNDSVDNYYLMKEVIEDAKKYRKRIANLQQRTKEAIENKSKVVNTKSYQKSIKLFKLLDKTIKDYTYTDNYDKLLEDKMFERVKNIKQPNGTKTDKARYNKEYKLLVEVVKKEIELEQSQKITEIKALIKKDKNYKEHIEVYKKLVDLEKKLKNINTKIETLNKEIKENIEFNERTKERILKNGPILKDLYEKIKANSQENYFLALDLDKVKEFKKNKTERINDN